MSKEGYDPKAEGYLFSEEFEDNKAHRKVNMKRNYEYVHTAGAVLQSVKVSLKDGHSMELAKRALKKCDEYNRDYVDINDKVIPIILEKDEIRTTIDDTLSNLSSKVMYTVIAPEGIDYREALAKSTIKEVKMKQQLPGAMPQLPKAPYYLDIEKDLAPTYLRIQKNPPSKTIKEFDESKNYTRSLVASKDDKDMIESMGIHSKYNKDSRIESIAQQSRLYYTDLNKTHLLAINNANNKPEEAYPSRYGIDNSTQYILNKNK